MSNKPKEPSSCEDDWQYNFHVVAFLDILGQREAFHEIKGLPRDTKGKAQLIEVLKKTIGFVPKFRQGFKDIFERYAETTGKEKEIPEQFRNEFMKMRQCSIKLYGLSDAVVAWTSLREDDQCVPLNSLYGIIMATAGMFAFSLACKHAIRGAIELDGAITLEPGSVEIYGPALNKAYELESIHAQHPRILVGDGVLKYLNDMTAIPISNRASAHNNHVAKQCLKLITKDCDGRFIVDYLGSEILSIAPDALTEKEILIPARQFIWNEFDHWRRMGNTKLSERYEIVMKYFNNRLPGMRETPLLP